MNPGLVTEVLWDYNISTENNMMAVMKELMSKAFKAALTTEE